MTACASLLISLTLMAWLKGAAGWSFWWEDLENNNADELEKQGTEEEVTDSWAIFPGTKWCGAGSNAENYDDLGKYEETDKCCRDHDYCDDIIEAGQSKYGLTNDGYYTKLHCDCDYKFRECLHNAKDYVSAKVGYTYFNVLNTQCYREDYPITGCKTYSTVSRRCVEYDYDTTKEKKWQWFDVPTY